MSSLIVKIKKGVQKLRLFRRVSRLNRDIAANAVTDRSQKPVVFFNASARLEGLNLNGAFNLITSWGVQLAGREVYHFACRAGMSQCVLGAGLGNPDAPPPCRGCMEYTRLFTGAARQVWFDYREDPQLNALLDGRPVPSLEDIVYKDRPLGKLVLPSTRWILRRHHLQDDENTRTLFRKYILSGNSIADAFSGFLDQVQPEAVVVFNGLQYPEAVVRWVANKRGIRVITHEVNLQPFSAFFTEGQATIYPLRIPEDFHLTEAQNQLLDQYLNKRFQGDFKMAGIKFWSDMNRLPDDFLRFADKFDSLVPVFTNVIFDTSQAHANTLFEDMFDWLDLVLKTAARHPETLFVIRAHPDEMRQGKSSQESVLSWAAGQDLENLSNLKLIGPDENLSSYELIQRSKFTLVYNSSIGLEATLLGAPVLCAGKARYTQYPIVFYPETREAYEKQLEQFLDAHDIVVPAHFQDNARKFLYYQLYRASLPYNAFLYEHTTPGYVQLKNLSWESLKPGSSPVIDRIVNGILCGDEFLVEADV
jgi:hypothetical protein